MHKIYTLYGFELKKILMRKIVWITLAVMIALNIWIPFADLSSMGYWINGEDYTGYEFMAIDRDAARKLSGKTIDDTLLRKMQESYHNKEDTEPGTTYEIDRSTGFQSSVVSADDAESEETDTPGNKTDIKNARKYAPLFTYITEFISDHDTALNVNAEELYQERQREVSQCWIDQLLSEDEISYWEKKEHQITIPLTYEYTKGWIDLFKHICPLNYMLLLLTAMCLSGVFSIEHLRKTDQLILCSRHGKGSLYLAKILAGITFAIVSALLLFLVSAGTSLLIYGADGFHAALQLAFPSSSLPISVGTAVMIVFATFLAASALYSIVTMFLSGWLKNSVAVMAILAGSMIFTMMIDIPYGFRTASQIYDLLPTTLLVHWQLWDDRLVSVFGTYLTNFQTAWGIYLITGTALILIGARIYRKAAR